MNRLIIAAAIVAACTLPAAAHDYKLGVLHIEHPWARAMPPMTKVGAGYMIIENTGGEVDRLIAIETPRSGDVQIHEMKMDGDVAKMRHMENGLEIPAGGTATLQPGGYHLMFMGVTDAFEEGEKIPATLTFEKAGEVEVEFSVAPVGAPAPAGQGHGESHGGAGEPHGSRSDGGHSMSTMDHSNGKTE